MSPSHAEHASMDDDRLMRLILRRLAATTVVDAHDVQVEVHAGHVELSGSVMSFFDRLTCTEIAESIAGPGSVTNDLRCRP